MAVSSTDRSRGGSWRWCVGSVEEAVSEAGDEWHRLAVSTDAPPAALPLWSLSLYEAFGEIDGPVSVHRLYLGSRLVAVLPLSLTNGLYRTWHSYRHVCYGGLWAFAFDETVEGAAEEIRRHLLSSADMLDFKYILADQGPVPYLTDDVDPSRHSVETDPAEADVYLDLSGSWDQCQRQLSSGLRKHIRKALRLLESQGSLTLSVQTSSPHLDEIMTECLDLEKAGWKGRNETAISCSSATERFYRGLARRAGEAGLLALYTLRLDGRLIAFELNVRSGKRMDSEKIAYDETLSRESPGNVIAYMIAERECSQGVCAGYHWGSPNPHKARWTDHSNRLVRVLMFAEGIRGQCSRLAYTHARPIVRQCRQVLSRVTGGNAL